MALATTSVILTIQPNWGLGGSKDGVQYDRGDMAVPVGGDSRQWEQGWFEETAKDTKKVMGPSGEELKLKKDLLRAAIYFR